MTALKYILIVWPIFFVGCAFSGSSKMETGDHALKWVQKVVNASMPLGTLTVSRNGRIFRSNYFIKTQKKYIDAKRRENRYFAEVSILGDRRPYEVVVIVSMERKVSNFDYAVVKQDQRLAKKILNHIRDQLVKGRGKRNVIDDFRAF